jgi:AraC-like DNA-binding protein
MTIVYEGRASDSPYVDAVVRGQTMSNGSTIRPAASQWHMIIRKLEGQVRLLVVGPLTSAGVVTWEEGAELLWIRFAVGAFMPQRPTRSFLDLETTLPHESNRRFWLNNACWQFPDYDNVETFVERLVREEVLARDPLVGAALADDLPDIPLRTVRHRFLRATGMTRSHIRQIERAQRAAALLRQGKSILDTVDEAGYFDQPHLTRSLRQWVGYTPAQIVRMSATGRETAHDTIHQPGYDRLAQAEI